LIWKTIKEATQGHPNTKIKTLHIDINNTIYTNKTHPLKIADHFNEFFANITSKNANNYINTTESSVDNIVPSLPLQFLYLRKTNLSELKNIISSLKYGTAPGYDKISTDMIKLLDDRALEPLVLIINNIINTGVVPTSFKTAIITPIYKKGNPCKAENYRPISLLSNFSKIFERVIKSRLANYLEENQILPPSQFGFRKGLNPEGAINSLTQSIHHALDSKKKSNRYIYGFKKSLRLSLP